LEEFEEIQGLRLLLSGGEPLLHPHFWEINEMLRDYLFRSVLLSNGTLITKETARKLRVHEVQVSLDGTREGHDSIRGEGTFEKAIRAIDELQKVNIELSVATMIHRRNLKEFDALATLIQSKGIEEWNIDQPCLDGRLKNTRELWFHRQARYLQYGSGDTCFGEAETVLSPTAWSKCGSSCEPVGSIH
jgi:MoaA/NifB/PqqE/SkfB family radical SAM enzyme